MCGIEYQHLTTVANTIIALFTHLCKKDRDKGIGFLARLYHVTKGLRLAVGAVP
jgi:hypothetical protein